MRNRDHYNLYARTPSTVRSQMRVTAAKRAALIARLFAAHRLEEPRDPVERAVAGLPAWSR